MKQLAILVLVLATPAYARSEPAPDRWQSQVQRVTISRDEWGIAHVHGRSDADAVFGAIYAQAEDDFNRIESNYIDALGRRAEVDGEAALWRDLRQRLFVDPAVLKRDYAASPLWLRRLMNAWADGLNFYLATHPTTRPRLIARFEPWMALAFTEGSIGGDIERVALDPLKAFYDNPAPRSVALLPPAFDEPRGSNGIAVAPSNTAAGHALLLINPHTSFFFRAELQMSSDAGLDAYGASTWGQFFIYQGFNARAGWMHTSSGVDNVDEFAETVERGGRGGSHYRYGGGLRPVRILPITLRYRSPDGSSKQRTFVTYATHHGPVVRIDMSGKWIATAMMNRPGAALQQSWLRTKARDLAGFLRVGALQANSSNNTIFADADGEVAYLHPQFVPRRDDRFDYRKPVDGSDPATDWRGLHSLNELPQAIRPRVGWVMNTNDWPYSAAGLDSPVRANFPRYMDMFGENPRGEHATLLLRGRRDFTPQSLIAAAYDTYQPAFARLVPSLTAAYDRMPATDPGKARRAEAIALLRGWDYRWSVTSQPMSLAVFWAETLRDSIIDAADAADAPFQSYMITNTTDAQKLAALDEAMLRLTRDFGSWRVAWGQINRFQRLTGEIAPRFDDAAPSIPVGFTSGGWGSLASFGARRYPGTKRFYGASGNSFVAVVEFGTRPRAWAVSAGGESGDPASPHFNDQADRYASGDLRQVYFEPADIAAHATRRYRPGELTRFVAKD